MTNSLAEKLQRDRRALTGLHARVTDLSREEYNALVHAIWNIDRLERELLEVAKP